MFIFDPLKLGGAIVFSVLSGICVAGAAETLAEREAAVREVIAQHATPEHDPEAVEVILDEMAGTLPFYGDHFDNHPDHWEWNLDSLDLFFGNHMDLMVRDAGEKGRLNGLESHRAAIEKALEVHRARGAGRAEVEAMADEIASWKPLFEEALLEQLREVELVVVLPEAMAEVEAAADLLCPGDTDACRDTVLAAALIAMARNAIDEQWTSTAMSAAPGFPTGLLYWDQFVPEDPEQASARKSTRESMPRQHARGVFPAEGFEVRSLDDFGRRYANQLLSAMTNQMSGYRSGRLREPMAGQRDPYRDHYRLEDAGAAFARAEAMLDAME